jgi:tRNA(Ile)-lysidine synthase
VAPEFGLRLTAAHLHHGLRGLDADADLAAVEARCDALGIPLVRARWNAAARMQRRGLSGENGLRIVRRGFLLAVARRVSAVAIATAHTADDQLETLLMRLMRGSGLAGLAGMRPRAGRFLKPLLGATRDAIEADLRSAGIPWREDATNRDPRHLRNRLRHGVIPALRAAVRAPSRGAVALNAARAAADLQAAAAVVSGWAGARLRGAMRIQKNAMEIDAAALAGLEPPLSRLLLRHAWATLGPPPPGLTHGHLDTLVRLAGRTSRSGPVALPGGWHASRTRAGLRFERAAQRRPTHEPTRARVRTRWVEGRGARVLLAARPGVWEFFAASGIEGTVQVREGRADEAFIPFGRRRPVRLGEFLKRQRVSPELRERPPVLADARGILWVVGVRRAARAPVTASTRKALWVIAEP